MLDDMLEVLRANCIPEDTLNRFTLAVSEAFTNALVHGNEYDPNKSIKLILDVNSSHLAADIIDEGVGGINKVRHRRSPAILSEGGRGVDLMAHYAGVLRFTETEGGGLKVSIRLDWKKKNEVESIS